MFGKLFAVALGTFTFATLASDARAECNSVDTCSQTVSCSGGFDLRGSVAPFSFFCVKKEEAAVLLPICKEHNKNNDWKYDKAGLQCTRTRENGVVVNTKENLACPAGTQPNPPANFGPPMGCQKAESMSYKAPALGGGAGRPEDNQAKATRMLHCAVGGVKKTGSNYFCELYLTSPRLEDPTCAEFGDHKWTWSASKKKCTRTNGGTTLENDQNIKCDSVATYNAGSGKCVTPKGTYYAAPKLIDPK